jgi:hypothetical protein
MHKETCLCTLSVERCANSSIMASSGSSVIVYISIIRPSSQQQSNLWKDVELCQIGVLQGFFLSLSSPFAQSEVALASTKSRPRTFRELNCREKTENDFGPSWMGDCDTLTGKIWTALLKVKDCRFRLSCVHCALKGIRVLPM